jgi:hypothetical protein
VWLLAIGSAFANDIFGQRRGGCSSSQGIGSGSTETLNPMPLGALPPDPTCAAAAASVSFVRCPFIDALNCDGARGGLQHSTEQTVRDWIECKAACSC